ncbi:phenylacetate--CoA ligase family protein [Desulfoscipio gibsoniae]|uniref:Coenzyme F390 synthetase n=1 Tax=Desulfoscipio gibsoniae DSM 7213 TaxID=767817 RepID=R4KNP2_9FIRM|nr:phenylacetate--CoA ligase family protein [Desulfoscipio gibsoniae]AGL03182.1 coenzyme F390 synthetase [Desulfoscipio gibsoniae DSM 7213]
MAQYWNPEFETMVWPEIQSYWLNEVKKLIEYVKNNSEFYRDRLKLVNSEDIKTIDSLLKIPLLTKDDLRSAQENSDRNNPLGLFQVAPTENIVQVVSSSGTSGRPVYYGVTRDDLDNWRDSIATFFFTAGIRKEDVVGHVVGTPIFAGGSPYFEGIRHIGATGVWAGGQGSTPRTIKTLKHLHCTALVGTTSFDRFLGEHFQEVTGLEAKELGVLKVLGGGEPGLGEESIRRKVKEIWNAATVREIMGLSDVLPGMWAECEEESGMHFTAQKYVMVELIDPTTGNHLPWEPGVCGEAVYTTIRREATPVLRYRSADLIRVEGVTCNCGRTSPRIRCIGRVDDMLVYKAMNVFPSAIRDVVLKHFEPFLTGHLQIVKENAHQVRFDTAIPVDIEVISLEENLPALKQEIEQKVRELLSARIEVNLVAPDSLPKTEYKTPLIRVRG